jgi:transposase
MDTQPRAQKMTLQEMEARRLRAAELFAAGASGSQVARELGVSAEAACTWRRKWREGGIEALRASPRRGRKPSLGPEERRALEVALRAGPKRQGYETDLWTLERIGKLILKLFGVRLSTTQVWRVMGQMGWSCQKPAKRAKERDEDRIAAWVAEEWPRIRGGH